MTNTFRMYPFLLICLMAAIFVPIQEPGGTKHLNGKGSMQTVFLENYTL